jgi:hypothetical protein
MIDYTKLYMRLREIEDETEHMEIAMKQLTAIWFYGYAILAMGLVCWLLKKGLIG